mmetsp:Transcript_2005/g.2828  ORF Transcript_2005/g.2828 Transcript_2005/m.2828 type:complete len:215 (+) Transcript_2005:3-647(+)
MVATIVSASVSITSPRWMAPEVLAGETYSKSADVFSFGVVLWELLTLMVPWEDKTSWQIMHAVVELKERLPLPPTPQVPYRPLFGFEDYSSLSGCEEFCSLIEECFASATERPTFSNIIPRLQTIFDGATKANKIPLQRSGLPASKNQKSQFHPPPSRSESGRSQVLRESNSRNTIAMNSERQAMKNALSPTHSIVADAQLKDTFLDGTNGLAI